MYGSRFFCFQLGPKLILPAYEKLTRWFTFETISFVLAVSVAVFVQLTIRYYTRCYVNMRSKSGIIQSAKSNSRNQKLKKVWKKAK